MSHRTPRILSGGWTRKSPRSQLLAGPLVLAIVVASVTAGAAPARAAATSGFWSVDRTIGDHLQINQAGYLANLRDDPTIVVSRTGAAVATWSGPLQRGGGVPDAFVATKDPGRGWTPPRRLTGPQGDGQAFAGIDRAGRAIVAWTSQTASTRSHTRWALHIPGRGWSAPRRIPGHRPGDGLDSLAVAPSGFAVFGWHRDGVGYAQVVTPRLRWRPAHRLSDLVVDGVRVRPGLGVWATGVAIDNNGTVTAAWNWWTENDQSGILKTAQRGGLTAGDRRLPVITLARDQFAEREPLLVRRSPSGSAAVVWAVATGANASQLSQRIAVRLAGEQWRRHELPVSSGSSGRADGSVGEVAVAVRARSALVWWEVDGVDGTLRLERSAYRGGAWTLPVAEKVWEPDADGALPNLYRLVGVRTARVRIVAWTVYFGQWDGRHETALRTVSDLERRTVLFPGQSAAFGISAMGVRAGFVWARPAAFGAYHYIVCARLH